MYKQEVKYTNFLTEQEETRTVYMNLNKKEALEFSTTHKNKLDELSSIKARGEIINEKLKKGIEIPQEESLEIGQALYDLAKFFIDITYGEITDEGGFDKDPALLTKFKKSDAYSELAASFVEEPSLIEKMLLGIMPQNMRQQMQQQLVAINK